MQKLRKKRRESSIGFNPFSNQERWIWVYSRNSKQRVLSLIRVEWQLQFIHQKVTLTPFLKDSRSMKNLFSIAQILLRNMQVIDPRIFQVKVITIGSTINLSTINSLSFWCSWCWCFCGTDVWFDEKILWRLLLRKKRERKKEERK